MICCTEKMEISCPIRTDCPCRVPLKFWIIWFRKFQVVCCVKNSTWYATRRAGIVKSWDSWGWCSVCIDALGRSSSSKVDWKQADSWGGYGYGCRCKSKWKLGLIWAASVIVDKTVNYTVVSLACCTHNGKYCRDRTSKTVAASEPCAQQHQDRKSVV